MYVGTSCILEDSALISEYYPLVPSQLVRLGRECTGDQDADGAAWVTLAKPDND